jgi:hypothetical protein
MPPGSDRNLPVNYVFVDYENVHAVDLTLIGSKTVYFHAFAWGATEQVGRGVGREINGPCRRATIPAESMKVERERLKGSQPLFVS